MGCEHRLPPGAFNLPPGCTLKDIEDNAGCDEPTCDSCGEECRDLQGGLCRDCKEKEVK